MTVSDEADERVREHRKLPKTKGGRLLDIGPAGQSFDLQSAQLEDENLKRLAQDALTPCGIRRAHYDAKGFVAVALPTAENARLASQQGVFLFNGALVCTFEKSLKLMMENVSVPWYKRFQVPAAELSKIEEKLFQFNIYELSLFPDTEG